MPNTRSTAAPAVVRPPSKHEMALMIWLAVFPTLLMINLVLSEWLTMLPTAVRTLVLATIAVPIVIYGLLPILHKLRRTILARRAVAILANK
ncbi:MULTISPECIES: hypothetical protein [unclassified Salinibacterium]|uniref:hypothetical protein n=1 Tax=unclassified Salinibacterium TaxID=2632331 RepID=UPI001421BEA6|nr:MULTISPECIES: hypothetical protein [unclassified Salinibacterium]